MATSSPRMDGGARSAAYVPKTPFRERREKRRGAEFPGTNTISICLSPAGRSQRKEEEAPIPPSSSSSSSSIHLFLLCPLLFANKTIGRGPVTWIDPLVARGIHHARSGNPRQMRAFHGRLVTVDCVLVACASRKIERGGGEEEEAGQRGRREIAPSFLPRL